MGISEDGQAPAADKGRVKISQVRLRGGQIVQWQGHACDRWDASQNLLLTLLTEPAPHILIEDVAGEHLCLTLDGIAFKYYAQAKES